MDFYDALRSVCDYEGLTLRGLSESMGRAPAYVSGAITRGSAPRVDTAARMLGTCGWSLEAMPSADVPPGALVIDGTRPADARTPGAAPARPTTPARATPRRAPSADVDALAGALAALPPSARAALARALAPADAPDADAADDAR